MNREILFRGKQKDNGEWKYGDLLTPTDFMDIWEISENKGMGDRFEVEPETVGQFTGICDKNGKKIFEDDIAVYYKAEDLDTEHAVVVFDDGKFKLKYVYGYLDDLDSLTASMEIIIGNTYDGIYGEGKK